MIHRVMYIKRWCWNWPAVYGPSAMAGFLWLSSDELQAFSELEQQSPELKAVFIYIMRRYFVVSILRSNHTGQVEYER